MSYKSLYKLFVMNDNTTFNSIYHEKFNSDSTIKFDIYINNNQAFFTYDKHIMKVISNIRELDYHITDVFENLPDIAKEQFMRKSLIDEIEYTNEIEGVISTRKHINDLINEIERKIVIRNRFEGIVNKYLYLSEEKISLNTSSDIRTLFDNILFNEISEEDINNLPDGTLFRKGQVNVYKTSNNIVHSGITPEENIINYIDKSLQILNNTEIDILVRIAIFHYLFGYIHPFYDGNGRINRFISSYLLSKYFNKVLGYRLSMTIYENLSLYLESFNHTNDIRNKADLSTFVYDFLTIVYNAFKKTKIYAIEKKETFNKYKLLLEKTCIKYNLKKEVKELLLILIHCSIFGDFGLSKSNLCEKLNKGNTKTTEYLGVLKKYNLCIDIHSNKYHYYKANLEELDKIEVI